MTQRKATTKKTPDAVRGAYVGHPRGFGFLVLEAGGDDLFVPPGAEGDAIDGDQVEATRGDRGTARIVRIGNIMIDAYELMRPAIEAAATRNGR